jgi:SpoVK/Ycf46/Vps4 family AAA+-type ATPase
VSVRCLVAITVFRLSIPQTTDSAFVDRADIVQYVDLPSREAIYEILRTCLCEIVRKGIVASFVRIYRSFEMSDRLFFTRLFRL